MHNKLAAEEMHVFWTIGQQKWKEISSESKIVNFAAKEVPVILHALEHIFSCEK